jgi:3-oxoacyl-[acyl-carrier protein] reductase
LAAIISSPMTADLFPQETTDQLVPMKRASRPDEVASLVRFPASDQVAYISGQVISITGAMA